MSPAVPTEVAAALPSYPDDNKNRATVGKWYQNLTRAQAQVRRLPFYNILSLGVGQTVQALAGEVQGVAQPDLSRFAAEAEKAPQPAGEEAGATPKTGAEAAPAKPAPAAGRPGRASPGPRSGHPRGPPKRPSRPNASTSTPPSGSTMPPSNPARRTSTRCGRPS